MRIPPNLRDLLSDSAEESGVLALWASVAQLLQDNKTPFFPDYTDHGVAHIERTLATAVRLVPDAVWAEGDLLTSTDGAVLVAAVLLHDVAMHVREPGFLELVAADSPYAPLPWFRDPHGARDPDASWAVLWDAFRSEARHFTKARLDVLLGPGNAGVPAIAYGDRDKASESWTTQDRLLVGEFLRRHHARLAHEVAHYGFPGARDLLPGLGGDLDADAVGVVARSHGEALRTCVDYLEWDSAGSLRPHGAVLPYLMGLLRVADYLQIDASRAPSLLMRLRNPQSRSSIDEWNKHGAVARVVWDNRDPLAVSVEVTPSHGLRSHLQLQELIAGLQTELDTTSAVLRELYSGRLDRLAISKQRVRTNLDDEGLHQRLEFFPRPARLRSGDDLFRLVVRDLYGYHPVVAGRELLQNAVDAVRDRRRYEQASGRTLPVGMFREQDCDVCIGLELKAGGDAVLRVSDKGVGMSPDTVVDYFLAAGASFGPSPELLDRAGPEKAVDWMKAGRFGVGAFASFVLGTEARVTTRHADHERGLKFHARLDSDLIDLNWCEAPIGTCVEVLFRADELPEPNTFARAANLAPPELYMREVAQYYVLAEPTVSYCISDDDGSRVLDDVRGPVPRPGTDLAESEWRETHAPGVDTILWMPKTWLGTRRATRTGSSLTNIAHNGLEIRHPNSGSPMTRSGYEWESAELAEAVARPYVAVFDSQHHVGLSLTRFELLSSSLPFEPALAQSIGLDLLAHGLVLGAERHPLGAGSFGLVAVAVGDGWFPLSRSFFDAFFGADAVLLAIWQGTALSSKEKARRLLALLREETSTDDRLLVVRLDDRDELGTATDELASVAQGTSSDPARRHRVIETEQLISTLWQAEQVRIEDGFTGAESPEERRRALERSEVTVLTRRQHARADGYMTLAAPWIEVIGTPLPQERGARAAAAMDALANCPELQPYANGWRWVESRRRTTIDD